MLLLLFEQFLIVINFYSVNVMLTLYNFYMTNDGRIKNFILPLALYRKSVILIMHPKLKKARPAKRRSLPKTRR